MSRKRTGTFKRFLVKAIIIAILYAIGLGWLVPFLVTFTGCSAAEVGGVSQSQPAQPPTTTPPPSPTLATNASFSQSILLPFATTRRIAEETGRPWMILLTASWCEPCQRLKSGPVAELHKEGWMDRQKYLYTVVDVDQNPEAIESIGNGGKTGTIPQVIVYRRSSRGWLVTRAVGYMQKEPLRAFLAKASGVGITRTIRKP